MKAAQQVFNRSAKNYAYNPITLTVWLLFVVLFSANVNAQLPGVRDELPVFEETTLTLTIPHLQLGNDRLWVSMQLNNQGIMIVRDARAANGDSVVNAVLDERTGLVTVPVAAIAVNGQVAPPRYHLVLKLEATSPQYRLSIHSLEEHQSSIIRVAENTRGSTGLQIRHNSGERLTVFGRPLTNGIIAMPEAVLYQNASGNSATILMDNDGRPMTVQSGDVFMSFTDYSPSAVRVNFRYANDAPVVRNVRINTAVSALMTANKVWPVSAADQAMQVAQDVSAAAKQAICAAAEFQQQVATGDMQWAPAACQGMLLNMGATRHAPRSAVSACSTRAGECADIRVAQLETQLNRDIQRLISLTQPPVSGSCTDGNVPHLTVLDLGNAFAVRVDRNRLYSAGYSGLLALGNTFQEMYNSQPVAGLVNRDSFRNVLTALSSPFALANVMYSGNRETTAATDLYLLPVTTSGLFSIAQLNEIQGDLTPTIQFGQDYYSMAILRTARTVGGSFNVGLAINGLRAPENVSYQLPTYRANPSGAMGCITARSNSDYLIIHKSPIQLTSGTTNSFIEMQVTGGSAFWGERVRALRVNAQPLPPVRPPLTVRLGGNGQGLVVGTPAGISCGSSCRALFDKDQRVTLNATAASGSTFTGWGGACSGSGAQCTVTMDQASTVIAYFVSNSAGRNDPFNVRGSSWSLNVTLRLATDNGDVGYCEWRGEMYLNADLTGYFPPETLVRDDNDDCLDGEGRADFKYRFSEGGIVIYDATGPGVEPDAGEFELWYVNNNLLQAEDVYDDGFLSEIYTFRATRR